MRAYTGTVKLRFHGSSLAISPLAGFRGVGRQAGFTFLEIMLVVVIIGILVSVVGPSLVGKSKTAKISAAKSQINSLKLALGMFEMETGSFPSTEEGLKALVVKPSRLDDSEWNGPYIEELQIPKDPWHVDYNYLYPGENGVHYDIWSTGPDKSDGSEDDVNSWAKLDQ